MKTLKYEILKICERDWKRKCDLTGALFKVVDKKIKQFKDRIERNGWLDSEEVLSVQNDVDEVFGLEGILDA